MGLTIILLLAVWISLWIIFAPTKRKKVSQYEFETSLNKIMGTTNKTQLSMMSLSKQVDPVKCAADKIEADIARDLFYGVGANPNDVSDAAQYLMASTKPIPIWKDLPAPESKKNAAPKKKTKKKIKTKKKAKK